MNLTLTTKSAFGIVLISLLLAFGIGSAVLWLGTTYLPDRDFHSLLFFSIFIGQGFLICPLLAFLIVRRDSIVQRLRLLPVRLPVLLATGLLSLGIVIISDEIDRLIGMVSPQPEYLSQMVEMLKFDSFGSFVFLTVSIVIFAPLGEELLFRGFLQKFLEESWKDITRAVLVTSMFFAFIHMNPYWIIQIYLLGVILGYLAWRTGSVIPSFILHGFNNGLALYLNNISPAMDRLYTWHTHVSPLWLLLAIGFVIIGIKWLHLAVEDYS